ncbi:NUDIX domain-containing protein [Sphingomonas sp. G-3-2-10]|uniref:NUDIX hydrolase n=1 Tax=Sphingomonas sp. G-3-2-10 TaxID=2728838 RepID=UPI00146D88BA|nr:NUDIX domain-containing protein [Sphingomonas sp. G-3-2-10]NML06596.1 NUDIX domain-containing protein [Sphingomonas sp. G-3-2-10]
MSEAEIHPAATIVVMREVAGGPPELLMVERAKAMSFAGGALVFPGGRIDAGDHVLAELIDGDVDENAARIGGIRETLEEAGIAVGLDVDPAAIPELRRALYAGEPMGAAFEAAGAILRLEALVPFARWLPKSVNHKVFDTRFYLARAPQGAEPVVDGNENTRAFWMSARDVLAECDAGRASIIFPTRRNLERLALFGSWDDAVADANAHPVRILTPWIEERGGERHLCIPDDLGYPVTSQILSEAVRG